MSETAARNKELVREIIQKVVNEGNADLAVRYYREDYIQHNPHVAPGLAGLQELIRSMHAKGNPPRAEIVLINAEDDMVWLLLKWSGGELPDGLPRIRRTVEIFRVEDGRMAEHWDVLELAQD